MMSVSNQMCPKPFQKMISRNQGYVMVCWDKSPNDLLGKSRMNRNNPKTFIKLPTSLEDNPWIFSFRVFIDSPICPVDKTFATFSVLRLFFNLLYLHWIVFCLHRYGARCENILWHFYRLKLNIHSTLEIMGQRSKTWCIIRSFILSNLFKSRHERVPS